MNFPSPTLDDRSLLYLFFKTDLMSVLEMYQLNYMVSGRAQFVMQSAVVLTWGCSHNQKDSQLIEQQLVNGGYSLLSTDNASEAEIVVLNTCTVKTPTEDKIFHVLDKLKESDQTVVIAGCISQAEPEFIQSKYPDFITLGVNAAPHILNALSKSNGYTIQLPMIQNLQLGSRNNKEDWTEKTEMAATQLNPHLNIVQINEGCLNSCTFCATNKARGHLRSFTSSSIINSIRRTPTPEVWLTSQDTACWGFDVEENLSDLVHDIDNIHRKLWVRVGMGNPNNMIKVLDEVVESFHSDKIYKFLHLPVQSGNNRILNHMKRGYTVEEYEQIVERFRQDFPRLTLSTDIITGYPTETEDEFQDTIRTIKKTRPAITNISRYWERRGTPAIEFKQVPKEIRKERSTYLAKLCKQIQQEDNQKWIDWEGEIYLAEEGSKGGIQARNFAYKPIIVQDNNLQVGGWSKVKVTEAKSTYLLGEILS